MSWHQVGKDALPQDASFLLGNYHHGLLLLEQDTSQSYQDFMKIKLQICDTYDVTLGACVLQKLYSHVQSLWVPLSVVSKCQSLLQSF